MLCSNQLLFYAFYSPSPQYPMDKNKGLKVPVQIRVNMWLGLSAHEKKFSSYSEGSFSVFAELVCFSHTYLGFTHKYYIVIHVLLQVFSAPKTKPVFLCITVRKSGSGVRKVGDYGTGGAP